MLKDFIKSLYEKVYIINFEQCSYTIFDQGTTCKSWEMVCLDG